MCVFVVCLLAYIASLYFLVFLCVVSNSLILLLLFTPFFCEERGGRHGGEATFEGKKACGRKKIHTYIRRRRKQARKEIKTALGFILFYQLRGFPILLSPTHGYLSGERSRLKPARERKMKET